MKLLLISDSHGNKAGIDKLFKRYQFDYLFHMGDGVKDLGLYSNLDNVICVAGNCDMFSYEAEERVVKIVDKKILITHGHRYSVKSGLSKLIARGNELSVDLIFYGHTHNANYLYEDNIYIVNPGAFQKGKCVMLTIDDEVTIENLEIN